MKYSICCHTRDFKEINQFIDYHLNLGFDRIVIYDNMSIIPVEYNNNKVIIVRWDEPIVDFNTYNHYIKNYCDYEGWTAFIDEDEFINTIGLSIQEAMLPYQNYDSLGINWKMFGGNIDEDNKNENILQKYRYFIPESSDISTHVKTIVKNDSVLEFHHPHFPKLKVDKKSYSVNGEIITNTPWCKPNFNKMHLNHYHLRGLEDYIKRQTRWIDILGTATKETVINKYNAHNILATEKLKENEI